MKIMSIYEFTSEEFFAEISKVVPSWDIEIVPKDYIDSPWKYSNGILIKVTATHKQYSQIVREKTIQTKGIADVFGKIEALKAPWHYGRVYSLIAHCIIENTPEDSKEHDKLCDNISSHFTQIFDDRKNNND